jgi:hypothetical protein
MTVNSEEVPTPIACSLSAAELPERLAEMSALGREALVDVQHSDRIATLRFAASAGIGDRLATIVAAESECCAFLAMQVSSTPDEVVLSITAPEGADRVLDELVSAFRGQPQGV